MGLYSIPTLPLETAIFKFSQSMVLLESIVCKSQHINEVTEFRGVSALVSPSAIISLNISVPLAINSFTK